MVPPCEAFFRAQATRCAGIVQRLSWRMTSPENSLFDHCISVHLQPHDLPQSRELELSD
jgi:hypothetical protein